MVRKEQQKKEAITLRKKGFSYNEILQKVLVAKSTLSLWLRDIGLSKRQKQRLTAKRYAAAQRGGEARKQARIARTEKIWQKAEQDISNISSRELWLMGIMLYWAEGAKEKEGNWGAGIKFANSDPNMLKLFIKWLIEVESVGRKDIGFSLFIHERKKRDIDAVKNFWARSLKFPVQAFSKVYFKKHNPKTNRKNTGDFYHGMIQITVKASSVLNRKIAGWVHGINKYYWGLSGDFPA